MAWKAIDQVMGDGINIEGCIVVSVDELGRMTCLLAVQFYDSNDYIIFNSTPQALAGVSKLDNKK